MKLHDCDSLSALSAGSIILNCLSLSEVVRKIMWEPRFNASSMNCLQ
jgi:hypothetical protein